MTTPHLQTTVFKVSCLRSDGITVFFEPDGSNHALPPGDAIRVEVVAPVGFEFEIWHKPESISIYAESEHGLRAWRESGEELDL